MHPSSKRAAARLTGESPLSQRTRRSVLPPSLLPKALLPLNYDPHILRQPLRREYNTVQPSFILEELEEIRNNLEAVAEAEEDKAEEDEVEEDEVEDWGVYYQSQQASQSQFGILTRLRPYASPYLMQEPLIVLAQRY